MKQRKAFTRLRQDLNKDFDPWMESEQKSIPPKYDIVENEWQEKFSNGWKYKRLAELCGNLHKIRWTVHTEERKEPVQFAIMCSQT